MKLMRVAEHPLVSIIVPTFRDNNRLAKLIDALKKQTFDKENYEVIIVNNDPDDDIADSFAGTLPYNFIILAETKPGSYSARNKGIRYAKGLIIGFTDSDCLPAKDWVEVAVNFLLTNTEYSRLAGNVILSYRENNPRVMELYDSIYSFRQEKNAAKGTSVTANMFCYRNLFEKVGFFDELFMSGQDLAWGKKAAGLGFKIKYLEDLVVLHPARNSFSELVKKAKRIEGGKSKIKENIRIKLGYLTKLLSPPIYQWKKRLRDLKGISFFKKGQLFLLRYLINLIRAVEFIRLNFIFKPYRF